MQSKPKDTRARCPQCKMATWNPDTAGFLADHDTLLGKRCSYNPAAKWLVVVNPYDAITGVFGSAMEDLAREHEVKMVGVYGPKVYRVQVSGIRPRVGTIFTRQEG